MEAVIGSVREHAQFPAGSEVTLEANPTSAQTDKLRSHVSAIEVLCLLYYLVL